MFTGIIADIGVVQHIDEGDDDKDWRIVISSKFPEESIELGASIACAGVCLTVAEKGKKQTVDEMGKEGSIDWFAAMVSQETLARTTISEWRTGDKVNLERPLKLGDELGGHMVSGHIDGVATVAEVEEKGESWQLIFEAPKELKRFIAEKGSVAIDGTSLTVNGVEDTKFSINIIPHTLEHTTFQYLRATDKVNLEVDIMARHIARLFEARS